MWLLFYIIAGALVTAYWVRSSPSREMRYLYFVTSPFWLITLIIKWLIPRSKKVS